jgi:nitronate monooxygenase
VAAVTGLPQIAAGGIMGPRQVRAVLAAGAAAAQCGTAFLRTPESAAHPLHKAALADPRYTATVVTRAFCDAIYPAAGRNPVFTYDGFIQAAQGYPESTPPALRAAAAARGDTEGMYLWAGQGYRLAAERPAAEIIERLRG